MGSIPHYMSIRPYYNLANEELMESIPHGTILVASILYYHITLYIIFGHLYTDCRIGMLDN